MKTIFNDLCIGVFASLWAITQTFVHLWWILSGRYEYACPIKFDVHQSTFHNDEPCEDALSIVFRNLIFEQNLTYNATFYANSTDEIMAANRQTRLTLPSFSETTSDILMLVYIILDGIWIVTSVSLLLASCCKFKEKSSLYFYMPWVIIGTVMVAFDVYCSIYFGLNIPENWTLLEWLENLGILDKKLPKSFSKLRENESENNSGIGFRAPVFLMTMFTSRFFFIWFINVLTVFAVFGIAKKVSGEKEAQQKRKSRKRHQSHSRRNSSANNTFNSTFEERVRNWQDFYGTLRGNRSKDSKLKSTSITYLETTANGTELRCIDLSSYDAFRKGRVRIASEKESSTDNETTMNSTFKYGFPEDTITIVVDPPSTSGSESGQGPGRHVSIAESSAHSITEEASSRF